MATTSGGNGRLSSQNLRDFLRIKEEDHHRTLIHRTTTNSGVDRNTIPGLTLSAILSDKVRPTAEEPRPPVQSNRTLLDIIRDDEDILGQDRGQSWRQLTERLRLSCRSAGGSSWTSTVPNVTVNNNDAGRFEDTNSLLPMRRSQREDNINDNSNEGEGGGGGGGDAVEVEQQQQQQQSGRVSLMTLLAETDGSVYVLEEEEKGVDLEEVVGGGGAGGDNNCCICMVRRKGAAFIPCGHTFCRLCSRQLLVERRNCPLCNASIHEILDIF